MRELTKNEMKNINGSGLSAALINAINKGILSIVDIGRYLGSSIRRLVNGNMCRY